MEIKYNMPLAKYTSYKVGGAAKIYFKPENLSELVMFIKQLPVNEKLLWLGLGSNVLIRDGGFDGAVIHIKNVLNDLTIIKLDVNGLLIKIGAGVSCAKLAKFCVEHNLGEGIWFAGIPGTIGGALHMNAGAFKGETWEHVISVEVIDRYGKISIKYPAEYNISYRSAIILGNLKDDKPSEWFVGATLWFKFTNTTSQNLQKELNLLLQARKDTQPIGTLNCGSVFKNPANNAAGKLIEAAQLKGKKLGNAVISEKHANFIINLGTATATDIESLIKFVQHEIFKKYNIMLEPEVKIIGK